VINWWKFVKAGVGVVVVLVLVLVVFNWYGDFKTASLVAASVTPTSTVDAGSASVIVTGTAGTTYGIMKLDGVNFRVKPTSSAKLIRTFKKGEKVTIFAKEGQWYKVKDKKNKSGWITTNADYVDLQVK
jgi:uncharacterized protein YgiM (DUF1202 family)